MPKLNRSLFLLLLVNLASSDDCFVDKDGLVTFVGKSNTASAQLAIKGKALSMKFKKIGSLSSTGIKVTFDFGGCKIFAYLEFKIKGPYILFNDRPTRSFYFTVKSELSHNCYGLQHSRREMQSDLHSSVQDEGNLKPIDVKIALGEVAKFFSIEFNGAKLYSKQISMKTGSIILVAAGSLGGLLLIIGSVGAIFYCIRHKQIKNKPVLKVSANNSKKLPIVSKPVHFSIQIDPQFPKIESQPATKKQQDETQQRRTSAAKVQCKSAKNNRI